MSGKETIEEQVKTLQRQFGGVVKLVKDLKLAVEALHKKDKVDEIQEILDAQTVIDEIIVANSDSIKNIDKEIKELINNKTKAETADGFVKIDTVDKKVKESNNSENLEVSGMKENKGKKCRQFNGGYCKYKAKCRFAHPEHICKEHIKNGTCDKKGCKDRHPKTCKWLSSRVGCKREGCNYLHVKFATSDKKQSTIHEFNCVSCKGIWENRDSVIGYIMENQEIHFCLNCDDWVKYKEKVFDDGWTLLDRDGYLKMGI